MYFFRKSLYGGKKFNSWKTVFYFVNNSHSYWQKNTKFLKNVLFQKFTQQ
jgi:hypothetical protein